MEYSKTTALKLVRDASALFPFLLLLLFSLFIWSPVRCNATQRLFTGVIRKHGIRIPNCGCKDSSLGGGHISFRFISSTFLSDGAIIEACFSKQPAKFQWNIATRTPPEGLRPPEATSMEARSELSTAESQSPHGSHTQKHTSQKKAINELMSNTRNAMLTKRALIWTDGGDKFSGRRLMVVPLPLAILFSALLFCDQTSTISKNNNTIKI